MLLKPLGAEKFCANRCRIRPGVTRHDITGRHPGRNTFDRRSEAAAQPFFFFGAAAGASAPFSNRGAATGAALTCLGFFASRFPRLSGFTRIEGGLPALDDITVKLRFAPGPSQGWQQTLSETIGTPRAL